MFDQTFDPTAEPGAHRPINPPYYFSVNNVDNPTAVAGTSMRRAWHLYWEGLIPEEDTDLELAVASLSIGTGESRGRVQSLIMAFYQLADLPRLHSLQHQFFHLDLNRLLAISTALAGLNPDHLPTVDEHLTEYLTPCAPNQMLPSTGAIKRKIAAIRDMVDDPRATGSRVRKNFNISVGTDGTAEVHAEVSPMDAQMIQDAVTQHAANTGKTEAEALVDLIREHINLDVTVNLYTAKDLADAPVWSSSVGWLDACSGVEWVGHATRFRDMDEAMGKHTSGHDPTPDIAAALTGRDGTCGFPGCNVKAENCDCDHRVNHADGGATCRHNCKRLCRHHHNPKTNGRIAYLMDPVTGITVWVLEDGSWAVDVPEGPLTPASARWAQTVSQYRTAHRKRWAAEARAEARAAAEATAEPQADEPPF